MRSDLRDRLGRYSEEALAADCTHFAGDYWKVWPTVLHVNLLRRAAGRDDMLWGVAFRSAPTRDQLRPAPDRPARVCVARGDSLRRAEKYGFTSLSLVEQRGAIDVYQPTLAGEVDGDQGNV